MKIPKYIKKKIEKRCELEEKLISLNVEINKWFESNGIEARMDDYSECSFDSFVLYTKPSTQRDTLLRFLENEEWVKMNENTHLVIWTNRKKKRGFYGK